MVYLPDSEEDPKHGVDEFSPDGEKGYGYGAESNHGYGQSPVSPRGGGRSVTDYLYWMLKYSWLIALTTFAGILFGLYTFSVSPPVYHSRASIEFKRIKREAVDVNESEKLQLDALAYFASTLQKLKMLSLYENIAASPTFADRDDLLPQRKQWRLPWQDEKPASGRQTLSAGQLASMMPGWVDVSQRENTTIVDLHARHSSPEVCRDVLEQLLIEYERYVDSEVSGSEKYALKFLFEKSEEIEAESITCQSSLDRYRECLKFDKLIEATRDKIVQLRTRYRDKWPPLIEAQELIRLASDEFDTELTNVLASSAVESEYWTKEMSLVEGAEDALAIKQKILHSRVNVLEKQLVQQEAMLTSVMTKISAADLSQGFEGKQFSIIQSPTLPGGRISPVRGELVRKGVMGGIAAGVGIVLLLGFLDTSMRTVADLEGVAGTPVVGVVSKVKDTEAARQRSLFVLNDPDSYNSESIRSLRASVSMLGDREERSTFLVTSALPGEGKSVISANLAASFAQQHDRTLLIDCDLRKPVQHRIFDSDPGAPGLSDHLAGQAELEDIMQKTSIPDLFVITSGTRTPNPAELLGSRAFAEFIREVSVHFDRVIIDSAPIIPVSDTLPVAREAHAVLLACQIGKTPRKALTRTMKILASNGTSPAGVIANQLPLPKNRLMYGYYYGYYGGTGYEAYSENSKTDSARGRVSSSRKGGRRAQRSSSRNKHRSDAHELLS